MRITMHSSRRMRAFSRSAAAVWAAVALAGAGASVPVMGQQVRQDGALLSVKGGSDAPAPVPGVTDKLGLDQGNDDLLGAPFESQTAGITFRPPAGGKQILKTDPDNVVEYVNDDKHWLLKVTRARLSKAMPLVSSKDKTGAQTVGLLDYTVQDVLQTNPKAEVLRQDVINVGEHNVGVMVVRLGLGTERFLRQQAIFQVDEQLYYVFNLTSPASKQGRPEDNPQERDAAESFKAMLDTIQPLNRAWIRQDQTNRLYRTRALFTDWSEKGGKRLRDAVVPQQWLRIVQNGKDIGYSYVAEEYVEGKDVKNNPSRAFDGVLVSMRTRTVAEGAQVDVGSQMFTSMDRKHEDWELIVNTVLDKGKPTQDKKQSMEFGYSELKIRHVPDPTAHPDPKTDPNARDPKNPVLRPVESYALRVERATQGRNANSQPEAHAPSPWYIPQAIGSMLPRLLPLDRPVTYLFQSYVSDQHEVVHRYVDVGYEKEVTIDGKKVKAIPISDRIRLEGAPTVHYMSRDGKYLGSQNAAAKVWILPIDRATLERLWLDADLRKQEAIERPGAGAAAPAPSSSDASGVRGDGAIQGRRAQQ
jgi:hypothetical protein